MVGFNSVQNSVQSSVQLEMVGLNSAQDSTNYSQLEDFNLVNIAINDDKVAMVKIS